MPLLPLESPTKAESQLSLFKPRTDGLVVFGYSNDLDKGLVLEALEHFERHHRKSRKFASVRFDTEERGHVQLHSDHWELHDYVNRHLPDATLSFRPGDHSDFVEVLHGFINAHDPDVIYGATFYVLTTRTVNPEYMLYVRSELPAYNIALNCFESSSNFLQFSTLSGGVSVSEDKSCILMVWKEYMEKLSMKHLFYAATCAVRGYGRLQFPTVIVPKLREAYTDVTFVVNFLDYPLEYTDKIKATLLLIDKRREGIEVIVASTRNIAHERAHDKEPIKVYSKNVNTYFVTLKLKTNARYSLRVEPFDVGKEGSIAVRAHVDCEPEEYLNFIGSSAP